MHEIGLLKFLYYRNCCIDHSQILYNDKDHQVLFVGDPDTSSTNPRWRMATILKMKNSKTHCQW